MKKILAMLFGALLAVNAFANYTYLETPSRSLNDVFQVDNSGNDMVDVCYSINISCTQTLTGGQTGIVYLEQSSDGSTGWVEIAEISNSSTGSVVLGVSLTDAKTMTLRGVVWPGYYVRLRTASTGSPTFTLITAQEMGFN